MNIMFLWLAKFKSTTWTCNGDGGHRSVREIVEGYYISQFNSIPNLEESITRTIENSVIGCPHKPMAEIISATYLGKIRIPNELVV